MVSSVSIIVIVMVTVGLSYYCYKLKTENRIEPSEDVGIQDVNNFNIYFFGFIARRNMMLRMEVSRHWRATREANHEDEDH